MKGWLKRIILVSLVVVISFGIAGLCYAEDQTDQNNSDTNELASGPDISGTAEMPLTVTDTNVRKFSLNEYEKPVTDKIADEIDEKNITISNITFKREGGIRVFAASEVKNITLNTKFIIQSVDIQDIDNHFTAILKPMKGEFLIDVSGVYSASKNVPMVTRNINKGDSITQEDIELKPYPKEKINGDMITDISNIIGKTATKAISKGQTISQDDLRNPVVIAKNSSVSAIYRTNNIEVKVLAIATQDGSLGDVITLKNFDSGKLFKAAVQADGTVLVGTNTKDLSLTSSNNTQDANNIN